MSEKRYIISDASKQVEVEAHVLRYWEEELSLKIPRNEMGHRYYTDKNITLLKNIKQLKEQGFQLKAIKMILPELENSEEPNLDVFLQRKDELNQKVMEEEHLFSPAALISRQEIEHPAPLHNNEEKMQQFQMILTEIVLKAVQQNNDALSKDIENRISDNMKNHVDNLMQNREEREEARFKKLDETIRAVQKERMESAATSEYILSDKNTRKKKHFFKRSHTKRGPKTK